MNYAIEGMDSRDMQIFECKQRRAVMRTLVPFSKSCEQEVDGKLSTQKNNPMNKPSPILMIGIVSATMIAGIILIKSLKK